MKNLLETAILEIFQGTGLFDIDATDYVVKDNPLRGGLEVIGAANELEKTCLAWLEAKNLEHDQLLSKLLNAGGPFEVNEIELNLQKMETNTTLVNSLLWKSVRRLIEPHGSKGVPFCNGNVVAAMMTAPQKKSFGLIVFSGFPKN